MYRSRLEPPFIKVMVLVTVKYHARVSVCTGMEQKVPFVLANRSAGVTFDQMPNRNVLNSLLNIFLLRHTLAGTTMATLTVAATTTTTTEMPTTSQAPLRFPFQTDADDHCESPLEAYQDIVPLLKAISEKAGLTCANLSIYDPYYCNGSVIQRLASLGFPNVYNRKEDCYQIWANNASPSFDVLVTNPPYSGDHIERLIRYVTTSPYAKSRPWCLLLPQWVHKKEYFVTATSSNGSPSQDAEVFPRPFFMVPHKRYVYLPPPSFRVAKKSDVHKKSSPFVSMWYIWGGSTVQTEQLLQIANRHVASTCAIARTKNALRDLRRRGGGSGKPPK